MKPSTIKFHCPGRAASARKLLIDVLRSAGYTVTTETRADDAATLKASDLVLITASESQRNGRRRAAGQGRRVRTGRTVVVTAEAPSAAGRRARRDARNAPAMNLQELREHVRQTQGDVARRAAVSQPQLSRVEGRRDHLVSTLRKYVRALGGDVKVVAEIGSERVVLRDV